MKYFVAMDVPTLVAMGCDCKAYIDFQKGIDGLLTLKDSRFYLSLWMLNHLFKANVRNNGMMKWLASKQFVSTVIDVDTKVSTIPDLLQGIVEPEMKEEIVRLDSFLHHNAECENLFLVNNERWKGNPSGTKLQTIRDKKPRTHETLVFDQGNSVTEFVKAEHPYLDQKKHYGDSYYRGGKPVSTFRLYAEKGQDAAQTLLDQAYQESIETDNVKFPDRLFTWDAYAGNYVEFRNSGQPMINLGYHGHDMQPSEYQIIPRHIREKYNH